MKSARSWKQQQQRCNCSFVLQHFVRKLKIWMHQFWMVERDVFLIIFAYLCFLWLRISLHLKHSGTVC